MADIQNSDYGDELELYVKEYKIFVDTCSILYEPGETFWMRLIDLLIGHHRFIFITSGVANELEKFANNKTIDNDLRDLAKTRLLMVRKMLDHDLVRIYGTETDTFADNVFQVAFMHYRMKYKLLLITQDNDLAKDILRFDADNIEPFRICKSVTSVPNTLLPNTLTPEVGSSLYTPSGHAIELVEEIASGGEGIVYKTNTKYVARNSN